MSIYIIDDHPLMRDAISDLLRDLSFDLTIKSFESIQALLSNDDICSNPSLISIEINNTGIENIIFLKKFFPETLIVVVSKHLKSDVENAVLNAGACCYIEKSMQITLIENIFTTLLSAIPTKPPRISNFTKRQCEILSLVERGLSNEEIAAKLNIKASSVKVHLSRLYASIGVKNRLQALSYAKNTSFWWKQVGQTYRILKVT